MLQGFKMFSALVICGAFTVMSDSSMAQSVGKEWDRGCEDAKGGSYDRSRHSDAYEEGWQSCKNDAASAGSAGTKCEFYSHGDKKKDRTGPCTFSQRQGYIDITLSDGKTFSLTPGQKAGHYKDQEDHKVERKEASGSKHVYKWEQKKIVVHFK